jgi:hypothetical protein
MSPGELLAHHDAEVDRRREELFRAEKDREEAIAKHRADHPLPDDVVAMLAHHVREGGALCCKAGREWLSEYVDEVWARVLNQWAYEVLSCSENSPERRQQYAQKVIDRRFEQWVDSGQGGGQ